MFLLGHKSKATEASTPPRGLLQVEHVAGFAPPQTKLISLRFCQSHSPVANSDPRPAYDPKMLQTRTKNKNILLFFLSSSPPLTTLTKPTENLQKTYKSHQTEPTQRHPRLSRIPASSTGHLGAEAEGPKIRQRLAPWRSGT